MPRKFDRHCVRWADSRALARTGISRATSMAMMPITTSNSTSVNADREAVPLRAEEMGDRLRMPNRPFVGESVDRLVEKGSTLAQFPGPHSAQTCAAAVRNLYTFSMPKSSVIGATL